jgi:hypothetical protein
MNWTLINEQNLLLVLREELPTTLELQIKPAPANTLWLTCGAGQFSSLRTF